MRLCLRNNSKKRKWVLHRELLCRNSNLCKYLMNFSYQRETRPEVRSYFSVDMTRQTVPDSFDARNVPGAVTSVRAQGDCGGCWAFSTVATLETVFFMKYKKTYKLSEKHLIDCDGFNDGYESTNLKLFSS